MKNILNKKRKKKGFTLIELVIVLAVLAIIALIAIPNFTKVRNDSLAKADKETANQIRKIALMAIADGDIAPTTATYLVGFTEGKYSGLTSAASITDENDVNEMMQEVKKPQKNGKENFLIKVSGDGSVSVGYPNSGEDDFEDDGKLSE